MTPSFEGNPFTLQGHEILSLKTRVFGAAHSEDFVILACAVLIGLKGVTDGQTDTSTMANTREALHAVARNKNFAVSLSNKCMSHKSFCLNAAMNNSEIIVNRLFCPSVGLSPMRKRTALVVQSLLHRCIGRLPVRRRQYFIG